MRSFLGTSETPGGVSGSELCGWAESGTWTADATDRNRSQRVKQVCGIQATWV